MFSSITGVRVYVLWVFLQLNTRQKVIGYKSVASVKALYSLFEIRKRINVILVVT